MRHRTVRDLMTRAVVSVRPGTSFKEIAQLLQEYDITAVCVVDGGDRPLGVVSEVDLLRAQTGWTGPLDLVSPALPDGLDRVKPDATTAEELMTSPAVCARPNWTVVEAARVMEEYNVKRLPVIDEADRLVGIVSRSDLLRVFLRQDSAIRAEVFEDVLVRLLNEAPSAVSVTVDDGRVVLTGSVSRRSAVPVLVRLCRSVDGVVSVEERLGWEVDDTVSAREGR